MNGLLLTEPSFTIPFYKLSYAYPVYIFVEEIIGFRITLETVPIIFHLIGYHENFDSLSHLIGYPT